MSEEEAFTAEVSADRELETIERIVSERLDAVCSARGDTEILVARAHEEFEKLLAETLRKATLPRTRR